MELRFVKFGEAKREMNMKRILNFIMLLTIIAGSASAQSLSVQPIEAKKGGQAELSVSLTGGTAMTALQFNRRTRQTLWRGAHALTQNCCQTKHKEWYVSDSLHH